MLTLLDANYPEQAFPSIEEALDEPDGLLAIGGCLSPNRIINAYRQGIFPWYSPGEPILWWSPNPRLVLFPEQLKISRSLNKTIRKQTFSITFDTAFPEVIKACSEPRTLEKGTWISNEIILAYNELYRLGAAHSVEAWHNGKLVGGLYGVAIGQIFFGESMFHRRTDASKVAFVLLVRSLQKWQYKLIDCQVHTDHLISLGANEISRQHFQRLLQQHCNTASGKNAWNKL